MEYVTLIVYSASVVCLIRWYSFAFEFSRFVVELVDPYTVCKAKEDDNKENDQEDHQEGTDKEADQEGAEETVEEGCAKEKGSADNFVTNRFLTAILHPNRLRRHRRHH